MKDLTPKDRIPKPSLYFRFLRFIEKITKKKTLIRFSIITLILFILFFPNLTGKIIGNWYNEITTAFSNVNK